MLFVWTVPGTCIFQIYTRSYFWKFQLIVTFGVGEGGVLQTADGQILTNEEGQPITSNLGQQAKNNLGQQSIATQWRLYVNYSILVQWSFESSFDLPVNSAFLHLIGVSDPDWVRFELGPGIRSRSSKAKITPQKREQINAGCSLWRARCSSIAWKSFMTAHELTIFALKIFNFSRP